MNLDQLREPVYRIIRPLTDWLVSGKVHPNALTTIGFLVTMSSAFFFHDDHVRIAGFLILLGGVFDILDGRVARLSGLGSKFGAFYDSTLDRVADGAVLGGLLYFYATSAQHASRIMVVVCLFGLIGTFVTSYTRARAESLGVDAKVGIMQRPERVTLLSAPQAFFGLIWDGYVLVAIVVLLCVTSGITACQRIAFVYRATMPNDRAERANANADASVEPFSHASAQPALKGE